MSKIINAVLSRFSAKYKSIDELGKLYLAQLQTKDYAAKTIQNKTCYVNHVCRLFNGLSVSQLAPAKIYRTLEAFNETRSQTAVYLSRRRREQAGWRYIVRQPATGGGSGEHATAAVRT